MRTVLLSAAALALLAACDARTVTVEIAPEKATYSRDPRTDLCFAAFGRAEGGSIGDVAKSFSVTTVPCSPQVLALIAKPQR
jgi:uncharacterized lipoprotein YajG